MTVSRIEDLHLLLSDYVVELEGDRVIGVSKEANALTRRGLIQQMETTTVIEENDEIREWNLQMLQVLNETSDEQFQQVLEEKRMMTKLQIGQSLFDPLTSEQKEELAKQLGISTTKEWKQEDRVRNVRQFRSLGVKELWNQFRKR